MKLILLLLPAILTAADWSRFRGPNGSGVSPESKDLPVEMGLDRNMAWRIPLPAGYSSPIVSGDRVFVTAYDTDSLYAIALDRKTGKILWRRESKIAWEIPKRGVNTPVSPTPVSDGKNLYVFFEGIGLISYGPDGDERWRVPLGPFINPYGIGSSPILAGDKLLMLCDNDTDSYLLALSTKDGKQLWKTPRLDVTHGFSTPILYQPKTGPMQTIVSGSYNVVAYSVDTGEKLWWVGGMAWQAKSLPVIDHDILYIHSWMADMAGIGLPSKLDQFDDVLKIHDLDHDHKLTKDEIPYKEMKDLFFLFDLNHDNFIDRAEWNNMLARNAAKNGVYAIRLDGGRGDLTKSNVLWRYDKQLPNIPSPLLYENVLYILREGGILTTLNPATGEIIKQSRVKDAVDPYFASPVAADGKVYLLTKTCKLAVLKAAGEWDVLAVNSVKDDDCWATPAISGNQIFLRTQTALFCFEKHV